MESLIEMWALVCEHLKASCGEVIYDIWFKPIEIISFDGAKAVLSASEFMRKIIEQKFANELKKAFNAVMGFVVEVELVDPSANAPAPAPAADRSAVASSLSIEKNTFETFVVGSSNRFAHAAAQAVAATPGAAYNPLFIYGNSGLGKTHLLCAISNEVKAKNPDADIIFTRGEDFVNLIVDGIKKKTMNEIHDKYRNCDVLLVDDIQFIAGKESTQEEFFHTFNALTQDGKQFVLTSDRTPKEFELLEERLRNRFEWGLIADIQPPDLELRIAIFKNKISQAGLNVSDEIITYLAENLRSNIRQIEGAVKKLVALKYLSGNEITMDIVKDCMSELLGDAEPIGVTVDKVFAAVEKKYGVTKAELVGKSRVKEVAQARHITIHLIRTLTEMSLPAIGKLFNRDHTTVLSSLDTIDKKTASSNLFEAEINNLIKEIRE